MQRRCPGMCAQLSAAAAAVGALKECMPYSAGGTHVQRVPQQNVGGRTLPVVHHEVPCKRPSQLRMRRVPLIVQRQQLRLQRCLLIPVLSSQWSNFLPIETIALCPAAARCTSITTPDIGGMAVMAVVLAARGRLARNQVHALQWPIVHPCSAGMGSGRCAEACSRSCPRPRP